MKRGITILTAAATILMAGVEIFAIAGPVMAQPITHEAVVNTDAYLDQHPQIAKRLAKDPTLIDNQQFVENHPGLQKYLHDHPNARHEFKSHPYKFMKREEAH
ncbi:MAG TPA: hypothetical protein VEO55_08100 [Candidatus Dormibacteraeota bacterium]|nr:hypothetical protein [Candidatus Dormibacteraeota bacterium]